MSGPTHLVFSAVKGVFLQSEDSTDDSTFDFKKEKFGIIHGEYDSQDSKRDASQWEKLEAYVHRLNKDSDDGTQYKVLFLGRHGQGWHNVAETKYGTADWDCYWSELDGADGITWADANLTAVGQGQAKDVNALWKSLLPEGIPGPETYYVSPLTRTIETADLTFEGLDLPSDRPYKPLAKELLREVIGIHTCDRRSTASHIRRTFPHVQLEENFSEPDPFWKPDAREPKSARRVRLTELLDDIFQHDPGQFLSLTSHSGAIASTLEVLGHRPFSLETGGVIPVLVKAQRVSGEREKVPNEPWETAPPCKNKPTAVPN